MKGPRYARRVAAYLSRILDAHRARAAADGRAADELLERARTAPAARDFAAALAGGRGVQVIAEIKRRSPSKGELAPGLDPEAVARAYAAGGAACLSVLTETDFFGGSDDDLRTARGAVALPVLRKDFTVDERDICDARLMGADAVLLIVAALDGAQLASFRRLAEELGMAALVEVHDEAELERALAAGASVVGVNQRDLRTFEVDTERAVRVAAQIPDGVVRVAESGIRDGADVSRLAVAGFHAVLVGETLVTAPDPAQALRDLLEAAPCS